MEIQVEVGDVNDNAPECPEANSVFEVQENEQIGKMQKIKCSTCSLQENVLFHSFSFSFN